MATLDWLSNWDDLVHGTVVFSAAVPIAIGVLIAWKLPPRHWWLGILAAVVGPFVWLFGLPTVPPRSSEDVAVLAVILAAIALALTPKLPPIASIVLGAGLFGWLQWCVYPAWLVDHGGTSRKLLVCGGVVTTMAVMGTGAEAAVSRLTAESAAAAKDRVSLSALVPPMIGLAILLQLGGAARLGQAAGALAAAAAALCLVVFVKNQEQRAALTPALLGVFFALLVWSGWLFAEVRYGLAAALGAAPIAGWLTRLLPLPRANEWQNQLWDGLASAVVSGAIAGVAISNYLADASEFEGY